MKAVPKTGWKPEVGSSRLATFDPSTIRAWRGNPIDDGTCFESS